MSVTPSPPPCRVPAGSTTDFPYGPMADSGYGNPVFYHAFCDDFDNSLGATGLWTVSAGGAGTVANAAGDGGLALFTTAGATNNFESIQTPSAGFTLPQGALAGKKAFFLTRLQLSDITNSAFIAGLISINATPFTSIADGVYFQKSSGGTVLNIISAIASTLTTTAIPVAFYNTFFANAVNIDLGWYIDRNGYLNAFVGQQLVGYLPQSGSGAVNSAGVSVSPTVGRCVQVTGLSLSTANLAPTLGVQTGQASSKTMTVDFVVAQKER